MKYLRLLILWLALTLLLSACGGSSNSTSTSNSSFNIVGGAIQGKPLSLSQIVSTFSGPLPSLDGMGNEAAFFNPQGVTTDGVNLFVVDSGNETIRKVTIATGVVTTFAGNKSSRGAADGTGTTARFSGPSSITTDGINLYITDSGNHTIRKIEITTGIVTTLAGSAGNEGTVDGIGTAARFSLPTGITTDGTNLYVADSGNCTVRKVVIATGAVTTLAGSVGNSGSSDGTGVVARFSYPQGITTDGTSLFVTDTNNHTIRKVLISNGSVTTLAGSAGSSGTTDGTGAAARFFYPKGLITDGTNLFLADTSNQTIRKVVINTGVVTTLAGDAGFFGSTDGTGTVAKFNGPAGITLSGGNLFVTDSGQGKIRKIVVASGVVTTLAGNPVNGNADGTGAAARFSSPLGITTDGVSLFIADARNDTIRRIDISTGMVTTLAGSGSAGATDGTGVSARFNWPHGITNDGKNLYVADQGNSTIRKVEISTGAVTTLAGSPGITGSIDGTGTAARFNRPSGITTDGTNLYVADLQNAVIRKVVVATGDVSTLAGTAGLLGWSDGTGTAASFWGPSGITTDGTNLYVTDDGNHLIRKVVIATGVVTTFAGIRGLAGSADGTGTAATFSTPRGITTDGKHLYVADFGDTIRKIVIATSEVTTVAGSAGNSGFIDGTSNVARFSNPEGITTDGVSLFVTDGDNDSIRKIR